MVWLAMFSGAWVPFQEWQAYPALGFGVWGVYLFDRLMDIKLLDPADPRLGLRHDFMRRHEAIMKWVAVGAVLACAAIILFTLPTALIGQHLLSGSRAQFGYIFPVLLLVVAFFSITVASAGSQDIPHTRNLIAGLAFSYGTAMLAHVQLGMEGIFHLLLAPESLCFALLCAMNISAIHFWEHSRASRDPDYKAAHELALTLPLVVLAGASVLFARSAGYDDETAVRQYFFYAVMISAALLFILNRIRSRFSLDALRVLADVAMVVPYPIFLAMSAG